MKLSLAFAHLVINSSDHFSAGGLGVRVRRISLVVLQPVTVRHHLVLEENKTEIRKAKTKAVVNLTMNFFSCQISAYHASFAPSSTAEHPFFVKENQ